MKELLSLISGFLIIALSNTFLNFISIDPKINFILVFIIMMSLYSKLPTLFLWILSFILGFFQDAWVGIYSFAYALLFLIIMMVGTYMRDKIIKESFGVTFFTSFVFVVFSVLYFNVLTTKTNFLYSFMSNSVINLIYITKTMIFISIVIIIINSIIRKMER